MAQLETTCTLSWNKSEERGNIEAVGCDTNKNVFVVLDGDLFQINDSEQFVLIRSLKPDKEDKTYQIFTICFDTQSRFYLSDSNGISIFKDVNEMEPLYTLNDWQGPINLSHPSDSLIGINYKENNTGVYSFIGWNKEDQKLFVKPMQVWGDNFGNWFMDGRDPTFSLRRAYYNDRIMLYLVDSKSYEIPEDGIRSLHMFTDENRRIFKLSHTFLSCPWEDLVMPFSIEIPHPEVPSELLLFTPTGIMTERSKTLLEFDDDKLDKYSSSFSATDYEGAGSKRTVYVTAFSGNSENILRVLHVKK